MNKTDIMGIMQVKKTQLAVLSVIFDGMMMVFLVPSLIEEAQARTDAKVYGPALTFFDNVKSHISEGSFFRIPEARGNSITWITWGQSPGIESNGAESGYVMADLKTWNGIFLSTVKFIFSNPEFTSNSCDATSSNPKYPVECWISGGFSAQLFYSVYDRSQQDTNKFCDILSKFGGFEQTKIIREKLHC